MWWGFGWNGFGGIWLDHFPESLNKRRHQRPSQKRIPMTRDTTNCTLKLQLRQNTVHRPASSLSGCCLHCQSDLKRCAVTLLMPIIPLCGWSSSIHKITNHFYALAVAVRALVPCFCKSQLFISCTHRIYTRRHLTEIRVSVFLWAFTRERVIVMDKRM